MDFSLLWTPPTFDVPSQLCAPLRCCPILGLGRPFEQENSCQLKSLFCKNLTNLESPTYNPVKLCFQDFSVDAPSISLSMHLEIQKLSFLLHSDLQQTQKTFQ